MIEPSEIENRLKEEFPDAHVEVEDFTGDKDHYRVTVVSEAFSGKKLIEQHRMVYAPFEEDIGGPIHAFSIKTYTPEKWKEHQSKQIQSSVDEV